MSRRTKIWAVVALALVVVAGLVAIFFPTIKRQFFKPTSSTIQNGQTVTNVSTSPDNTNASNNAVTPVTRKDIEETAAELDIPWEIAFLPDGRMLITERAGQLLLIGTDRKKIAVQGVRHQGEGGLLGMALHPKFSDNGLLYLYLTTVSGDGLINRVERYRLDGSTLADRKVILSDIPGASIHDGGRLAFGPDGLLYITTGDAGDSANAQDKTSLAGKILRLTDEGAVPDDNPFDSAVYSYGHRNVQGIAWDDRGRLWATEHGPSGVGSDSGQDELNLIEPGKNYGWPTIKGTQKQTGLESPIVQSGTTETWAPAGLAFLKGSLYFAGLRGESLYQATLTGDRSVDLTAHFREEFGRLRNVTVGPDGALYLLTNNTDGRGSPKEGDDKLIRVNPDIL